MEWIYAQYIAKGGGGGRKFKNICAKKGLTLCAAFEWSYTPPKNAVVASFPIILIKR